MKQKHRWQRRRSQSNQGFTLIEVLVVIIVIAVLFAISAPSWDAFLSRQRVGNAREQLLQTIRTAQNEARSTRSPRAVLFDTNPGGVPRVATLRYTTDSNVAANVSTIDTLRTQADWRNLGGGEIKPGQLQMSIVPAPTTANINWLVFDSDGALYRATPLPSDNKGFRVIVQGRANAPGTKRCVIVYTLLGATRLEDGTKCD